MKRSPSSVGRGWWTVLALLATAVVVLGLSACAPKTVATRAVARAGPRLSFQEWEHAFGQIPSSEPREYRFTFTNTGSQPLAIGELRPEPAHPGG